MNGSKKLNLLKFVFVICAMLIVNAICVKHVSATQLSSLKFKDCDKELTIVVGEKKNLKLKNGIYNVNANALVWKSSNRKTVAVFANGQIKGLKKGKSTITATLKENPAQSIQLKVTVGTKVSKIAIQDSDYIFVLEKGKSDTLKTVVDPTNASNKKVRYTSSKSNTIAVSASGKVTALKKGKAKIIAKAQDGTNKKDIIRVVVGTRVKSIDFSDEEETKELKEGSTHKMKVTIAPSKATNRKLAWSSSDESIATVNQNGVVKAISKGKVTITARSTDGSDLTIKRKISVVRYVESIALSLEEATVYCTSLSNQDVFVKRGESFQLEKEVKPALLANTELIWESNNPSVATVSATGKVTANGVGSAQITATANDGGAKSKRITIHVGRIKRSECELIAHRGRSDIAPDNSLSALRLAFNSNCDGVEFDIWKTADDDFAVCHNESLQAYCGVDANVTALTMAQIKQYRIIKGTNIDTYSNEYIPSLKDVLYAAKGTDKTLCIELKQPMSKEILQKMFSQIEDAGLMKQVKVISFHQSNLNLIRSMKDCGGDKMSLEWLVGYVDEGIVTYCKTNNISVGVNYFGLTEEMAKKLHEENIVLNVWTIPDFFSAYQVYNTMHVERITSNYLFCE